MTVFGDNFVLEGLRLPSVRERVEAVAARLMRIDPAYFAVCCCSDRDFYVGRERPERVPLEALGCMKCPKFARGCWGAEGGEAGMTYIDKLIAAVKVDDEMLTPCEADLLRDSLSKFFNHCLVVSSCPGHFFNGASHFRYRCDFGFDCVRCWNQEA